MPDPNQQQAPDSDSEDEDPEAKRRRKEEEWKAEKMRKILEIAENWDARVIESARKHKSLALLIEAKEEEKQRKAELTQRKWMKADPAAAAAVAAAAAAAAALEPVPAEDKYDPMEEHTWKERWLNDNRIKQVYSSSKILSKVKKKIKDQEQKERDDKARVEEETAAAEAEVQEEEPQGVIGSIQEYASLIGKSVKEMKDAQYEVPEESESEGEEEEEDGEDLWGAILGGGGS